jgi:UDP-glucose 4-epimerase
MTFVETRMNSYKGVPVLVTGGMGFIGSNLVIALVRRGARVTVVDAQIPGCGAEPANLEDVRGLIRLCTDDMHDAEKMRELIPGQEVIFNLAGEISHMRSIADPLRDLSLNCAAQLQFLNLCRLLNSRATIVYASSRQVYGCPEYLPVDEEHPVYPVDFNGVHKHAAEQYHFLLRRQFHMQTICLRLGNVYGPRQAIHQNCRGFIDAFLKAALAGEEINVFGDGRQLRGLLYVEDAVDAFLRAGLAGPQAAPVYNIGSPAPASLLEIAALFSRMTGGPSPRLAPFPPERLSIDIGSFYSTSEKFRRDFGWVPQTGMEEGLRETIRFFQSHRAISADAHSVPIS